jgi:hypothetical protein
MLKMSLVEFNKLKNNSNVNFAINKEQKYHSKSIKVDGIRFDSKKESKYYTQLKLAQQSGELLYFLRQVPIDISADIKYRVDFLEFWKNGEVRYVDVKGFRTKEYLLKKKLVESKYPIKIIEI